MAALTWIIPAGEFSKEIVDGKEVIVNDSFKSVKRNPQMPTDVLMAPISGFMETADIIIFLLIVGGAFGVLKKTGAVDASIYTVATMHEKHPIMEKILIPVIMVIFSAAGAVFGMSEEVIPFIMVFVPLAIMMGYDTLTGVAIPFIGAGAGFAGAFLNPFTIGIAQKFADLPPYSGLEYRLICWFVLTTASIIFVMRHANKVLHDPSKSPLPDIDKIWRDNLHVEGGQKFEKMTRTHKYVILTFMVGMVLLVVGVLKYGWYIKELAALFLGVGIAVAIVGRLDLQKTTSSFLDGAQELFSTALVVAVARGILIVASEGKIIDTILYGLSNVISGLPALVTSWAMFIVQSVLNFFIPSGSGKAALTMPIMAPLSDLVGVARQTTVLAYQFGDGFSNLIIPTSPVTMAILTIAKIPWERWAKWIVKLQILWFIIALILLIPPLFIW